MGGSVASKGATAEPPRYPSRPSQAAPAEPPEPKSEPGPESLVPTERSPRTPMHFSLVQPATAVLRLGPLGSSVAGNSPSGGASPPTPPSRCSRLGATRGGSGRKGRRAAGAAQARVRLLPHLAGHAHIAFSLGTDDTGPSRPRPRLQSPLPRKSDLR